MSRTGGQRSMGAGRRGPLTRTWLFSLGAAALATVAITAGAVANRGDPQTALAAGDATAAGPSVADLELKKSDSPDPVVTDTVLTYTIEVKNKGPDTATSVEVTDKLPGGVDFVSATATQGTCDRQGNTVTCALGDIADGATVTVTLKVRPKKKSGTIENTASVESSVQDSKPANDEDTESTTIREAAPGPTCKGKTATIVGTSGDDRGATALVGTSGRDVIAGLSGNDEIKGLNGKDLACGGPGNDVIKGGAKGDKLAGGGGRDKVNGGAGGDNIGGQGGGDKLIGRGGGDTIRGHRGKDVLKGNGGSDLLVGGPQRDKCSGGPGKDELRSC